MIRTAHAMFVGSLALAACAKDDPVASEPAREAPGFAVGASVFPTVTATTAYAAWGKLMDGAAVQRLAQFDLSLGYVARPSQSAPVTINVVSAGQPRTLTLPDGRPSIRIDLPPGVSDLLELLPAAGTSVELGRAYDSPNPDADYIISEADRDQQVLWQQMIQTPTAIVPVSGRTLVRVEGKGINRMHFVDDDGSLRSSDVGLAFLSITDLVHVPGQGWQVLRLARISDVEGAETLPSVDLAQARARRHAVFVVCASRMDLVGGQLAQLHASLLAGAPEFAVCTN